MVYGKYIYPWHYFWVVSIACVYIFIRGKTYIYSYVPIIYILSAISRTEIFGVLSW